MLNDSQVKDALQKYRKITVVGLSPRPDRPSHGVTEFLIGQGYEIVGVRPAQKQILGRPVYGSLAEAFAKHGPMEIVDVFRNSDSIPELVDEVLALPVKPKLLWLQEGITHPAAEAKAEGAGIAVVSDLCILKEILRLGI